MKRRDFIKMSSLASLSAVLGPNSLKAAAFSPLLLHSCVGINERVLVLIRLIGGNDGLNTIVPIDQYQAYQTLRPDLAIPDTGTDAYINLDATLPQQDQVGLHPILTPFKRLYDNGELSVIQGVMYDNQDRSHFKSTDLWMTGGDGTSANNNLGSGWVGRYLEEVYQNVVGNPTVYSTPLALQLAEKKPAILFDGHHHGHISTNLSGQDVGGYYSIINGIAGAPIANIPNSDHGDMLQYITNVARNANVYSQTISNAFNNGANSTSVTYPNHDLADQLKTVARLVHGGLQTKVFLVSLGGFDTHSNQVDATGGVQDPNGRHVRLLRALSESMEAFMNDIKALNIDQKFLTMTFSEFGRKVQQNGSHGTDHGGAAPMFAMGTCLNGGVIGTNVDLSEATPSNNYQITTKQFDYRAVYATVLQDWLGAGTTVVDQALMDNNNVAASYTTAKLGTLIDDTHKVDPSCYINRYVVAVDQPEVPDGITFYPVPARNFVNIELDHIITGKVIMTDTKGRMVLQKIVNNTNIVHLKFPALVAGVYIIVLETEDRRWTREIVVH